MQNFSQTSTGRDKNMIRQSARSDPRNILHVDINVELPEGDTHTNNSQTIQVHSHNSWLPQLMPGMKVDKLSHTYAQADCFAQSETLRERSA